MPAKPIDFDSPHRRLNPLTQEWVLVSPQRSRRPWLGQVEKTPPENLPAYDPTCYLCPGNPRVGGQVNPPYTGTFVFDNDFQALQQPAPGQADQPQPLNETPELLEARQEWGLSRVVCFSPRHDLSLPRLPQTEVEAVIRTWSEQTRELGSLPYVNYVQVFENKGAQMGASNPHPHSQIWAASRLPNEPAREQQSLSAYRQRHNRCLLCDYLAAERAHGERVVVSNQHFSVVVPYWAVWPFETLLVSHRHFGALPELTTQEVASLADILSRLTARYDNLFEVSFPYSMGFHQTPFDGQPHPEAHFHAHYYPPLLRSATVRKFMVGYEMLSMPQRDLTPEAAAARLQSLSDTHYLQGQ